jgi:hypothetical protein
MMTTLLMVCPVAARNHTAAAIVLHVVPIDILLSVFLISNAISPDIKGDCPSWSNLK